MQYGTKYFIPVCLYPHTKYRTRDGLNILFEKFSLSKNLSLIVVADRLLALDRLVTGRYWLPNNVFRKARREAEQIIRLIRRTAKSHGATNFIQMYFWDDVAGRDDYLIFAKALHQKIEESVGMSGQIDKFVGARIERFGSTAVPERARKAEYEYLMSEIAMSVFCTERLGFSTEIWERPVPNEIPDPLRILYSSYPALVSDVTGAPTSRDLVFLFDEDE